MSHELRTPAQRHPRLRAAAAAVERAPAGHRRRQGPSQIELAGRHLLELINEVLDLVAHRGRRPSTTSPQTGGPVRGGRRVRRAREHAGRGRAGAPDRPVPPIERPQLGHGRPQAARAGAQQPAVECGEVQPRGRSGHHRPGHDAGHGTVRVRVADTGRGADARAARAAVRAVHAQFGRRSVVRGTRHRPRDHAAAGGADGGGTIEVESEEGRPGTTVRPSSCTVRPAHRRCAPTTLPPARRAPHRLSTTGPPRRRASAVRGGQLVNVSLLRHALLRRHLRTAGRADGLTGLAMATAAPPPSTIVNTSTCPAWTASSCAATCAPTTHRHPALIRSSSAGRDAERRRPRARRRLRRVPHKPLDRSVTSSPRWTGAPRMTEAALQRRAVLAALAARRCRPAAAHRRSCRGLAPFLSPAALLAAFRRPARPPRARSSPAPWRPTRRCTPPLRQRRRGD